MAILWRGVDGIRVWIRVLCCQDEVLRQGTRMMGDRRVCGTAQERCLRAYGRSCGGWGIGEEVSMAGMYIVWTST